MRTKKRQGKASQPQSSMKQLRIETEHAYRAAEPVPYLPPGANLTATDLIMRLMSGR